MKKIISVLFLFLTVSFIYAQEGSKLIEKYVKGNISDKTSAVREASGNDAVWLSTNALGFVLQSKQILKNDRDLDGLAVAGVLAFPADYIRTTSFQNREILLDNFISVFNAFSDSTNVQTAILNKLVACKSSFDTSRFCTMVNTYISNTPNLDNNLAKSIVQFFKECGNSETFTVVYNLRSSNAYPSLKADLDEALLVLVGSSMNEAVNIIKDSDFLQAQELCSLFFVQKDKISKNSLCNIAENLISKSILYVEKTQTLSFDSETVLDEAVKILSDNQWTRSADLLVSYFKMVKPLFDKQMYTESHYIHLIRSLNTVSSVKAVSPLIETLGEMNSRAETPDAVSPEVVLAVIQTLGAVGDKSAFDVLLATTYYNYPEKVLSAAQLALAELKW